MRFLHLVSILAATTFLSACGGSSSSGSSSNIDQDDEQNENNDLPVGDDPLADALPEYVPVICRDDEGNRIRGTIPGAANRTQILDDIAGEKIYFEIYQPSVIDCDNIAKGAHPLILQGHGLEGRRATASDAFQELRDDGYAVISIDQRGFGQSTGFANIMDPDLEGEALLAILDYAEQNLDYLAWRNEATAEFVSRPTPALSVPGQTNLIVGTTGFSYGGGFQFLLQNIDTKHRIDAMAPEYTWHDLRYSLNPGDVVKSMWANVIATVGEANILSAQLLLTNPADLLQSNPTNRGLAFYIRETLIKGQLTNVFSRGTLDEFKYHSSNYWCELNGDPARPYGLRVTDPLPITIFPPDDGQPRQQIFNQPGADVLLSQGFRDVLFNFNEAWWNYQCMKNRADNGEQVTLMTHQYGHIVPLIQDGFEQSFAGVNTCGDLPVTDANRAFFNEKLKHQDPDPALDLLKTHLCFSLDNEEAVYVRYEDVMAPRAPGIEASEFATDYETINAAVSGYELSPLPLSVFDNDFTVTGVASVFSAIVPQSTRLLLAEKDMILAGIPLITVTISSDNESLCSLLLGCDPIVFVGLGKRSPGDLQYTLIDDQVTPIRGLGQQLDLEMAGIAEKLNKEDELALLVYGSHEQFFTSSSRELLAPKVSINADVKLPLYQADSPLIVRP